MDPGKPVKRTPQMNAIGEHLFQVLALCQALC